ncbi:MAG TPA: hypothetical protein VGR74_08915, partial [Actinomycetota bacterium]|nr:hypothetical protein [Actinomycetota bacterium]
MREPRLRRRHDAALDPSWLADAHLADKGEAPMQQSPSKRPTLSAAGKLNVAGMVTAAAGIIIQIGSGSELYPTIPPGPIILLAGAALVALGPWRWTPVVGVIVPLFLFVGAVVAAVNS